MNIILGYVFHHYETKIQMISQLQYLTMLREQELQKWVFEECHDINEMMFRFKDKERPQGYATTLANR